MAASEVYSELVKGSRSLTLEHNAD